MVSYYVGYNCRRSKYFNAAMLAAPIVGVAPKYYSAFAARVVYASRMGHYYKQKGDTYPWGATLGKDAESIAAYVERANPPYCPPARPAARLAYYVTRTKAETWVKWAAVANTAYKQFAIY